MYGYGSNDLRYVIRTNEFRRIQITRTTAKIDIKVQEPPKASDFVSQPLAKSQLLRKVLSDISRNVDSLGEMMSNFLFSLAKLRIFLSEMFF